MDRDHAIRTILAGCHGPARESAKMALLRKGPAEIDKLFRQRLATFKRRRDEAKESH